jgi:LPS-assembly protein
LLFAPPAPSTYSGRAQSASFGAHWKFGGFGVRYDALLTDKKVQRATGFGSTLALAQHTVGASYAPACDCFRLEVTATQRNFEQLRVPDFGATLSISRFGSFGYTQ